MKITKKFISTYLSLPSYFYSFIYCLLLLLSFIWFFISIFTDMLMNIWVKTIKKKDNTQTSFSFSLFLSYFISLILIFTNFQFFRKFIWYDFLQCCTWAAILLFLFRPPPPEIKVPTNHVVTPLDVYDVQRIL